MYNMQEHVKGRPSLFAANGCYFLAAAGLWVVLVFLGAALEPLLSGATPEQSNLLINLLYYVPFLLLPVLIHTRSRDCAADALRLKPIGFLTTLRIVCIAILGLLIAQDGTLLWMTLLQKLGFNVFVDAYVRPANTAELTLSVISAAIVAPVGEELLFRGVMLSAWERRGARRAVFATAVLFAMLHGSLIGLPGELFGGVMLGLVVIWTDSIYAGLVYHSVYNAGVTIQNYLSTAVAADAAEEALMRSDLLAYLGGAGTTLLLALDILLMLLILMMLTRRLRLAYALRNVAAGRRDGESALPVDPKLVFHPGMLFGEPEPEDRAPMSTGAALVLMAGIVSALCMYGFELVTMLGG